MTKTPGPLVPVCKMSARTEPLEVMSAKQGIKFSPASLLENIVAALKILASILRTLKPLPLPQYRLRSVGEVLRLDTHHFS